MGSNSGSGEPPAVPRILGVSCSGAPANWAAITLSQYAQFSVNCFVSSWLARPRIPRLKARPSVANRRRKNPRSSWLVMVVLQGNRCCHFAFLAGYEAEWLSGVQGPTLAADQDVLNPLGWQFPPQAVRRRLAILGCLIPDPE